MQTLNDTILLSYMKLVERQKKEKNVTEIKLSQGRYKQKTNPKNFMLVTSNKNLKLNLPTIKLLETPLSQYSPCGYAIFREFLGTFALLPRIC